MREIFTHQDFTRVGHFQSILEAAGIRTFIRNQYTHNSLTELPSGVFFPSLCVVNPGDFDEALALLRPLYNPPATDVPDWKCTSCGEQVPGNFESCWNCRADRGPA